MITPLVMVDGHNLLWRAAFGFPGRIKTREGIDRTGVFGFFALLRAALREVRPPPECIVCFDGEHGATERQRIDGRYKENRESADKTPIESLPDTLDGLDRLGIRWFYRDDSEADDVIAAVIANEAPRRIFIMSTDRDFYQIVGDTVYILNTRLKRGSQVIGPGEIAERYGVEPWQWCDYRALTPDASDRIAGVPGVGPVTAKGLLAGGIRLEEMRPLGRLNGWRSRPIRRKRTWDRLMKSLELLRLRTDTAVPGMTTGKPTPEMPLAAAVLRELDLW